MAMVILHPAVPWYTTLHSTMAHYQEKTAFTVSHDNQRCAQCIPQSHQCKHTTGWAAVERTLVHCDKQEIGSYKDDIDTLLVFTGLYSAVLAAFVVVSYTQLQEDSAAASLKVLRIIAANQNNGCPNACAQMADCTQSSATFSSSFQPSTAAIRVNVLWFASLVVSLSTASFAMLVKQWLRAYMAFASSSPQGQLRIRQFRREGLKTWKVFAIASTLPLLLQLSLALFFVGLCFFTINVHPAVGNTALPLICAWAFLLVSFTFSPIFSAQCPYKTPALYSITSLLRTRVWRPLVTIMIPPALRVISRIGRLIFYGLAVLLVTPAMLAGICLKTLLLGRRCPDEAFARFFNSIYDGVRDLRYSSWKGPQEERDVLNDNSLDLVILASADTFQANSELDLTIMRDALEQSAPTWDKAIEFLVQVIGNRVPLPAAFAEGPKGAPLDLIKLSSSTTAAISTLFDTYVISKLPEAIERDGPLPRSMATAGAWATYTFLSLHPSDVTIPTGILSACFDQWLSLTIRAGPGSLDLVMPTVLLRVVRDSNSTCQPQLLELMHAIFDILTSSLLGSEYRLDSFPAALFNEAANKLTQDLDACWKPAGNCDGMDASVYHTAVSLLFKICGAATLLGHHLDCGRLFDVWMGRLLSLRQLCGMSEDVMISWMSQPFQLVEENTLVLTHTLTGRCTRADYRFLAAVMRKVSRLAVMQNRSTAQLLNLSLIALRIMKLEDQGISHTIEVSTQVPQYPEPVHIDEASTATRLSSNKWHPAACTDFSHWRHVFLYIASAIWTNGTSLAGDMSKIASACWVEVDCILSLNPKYSTDCDETGSVIPDYFCIVLSKFYCHSGGWQADRIQNMTHEHQRRIRHDGEREIGRRAFG